MSGSVCVLMNLGGGVNMHSVFEVFSVPMCISRLNKVKWSERRVIPLLISVLDSKTNAPSSTYIMHNIPNRVPYEKVNGRWITNFLVDLGGLYCVQIGLRLLPWKSTRLLVFQRRP